VESVSGADGINSPACPDGYTYIGGEAEFGAQGGGVYVWSVAKRVGVEGALCQVFVDTSVTGGAENVTCKATCLR
jgi:hypothetical protein